MKRPSPTDSADPAAEELDALMDAARLFVHVAAASLAQVSDVVTPQQLRVLVLAGGQPGPNLSAVAADLDVHPSNATRVVDRLVDAGLLVRTDSPDDRRQVRLTLSPAGRRLVAKVMRHRRTALRRLLDDVPPGERAGLARCLRVLADVGGETPRNAAWPELG